MAYMEKNYKGVIELRKLMLKQTYPHPTVGGGPLPSLPVPVRHEGQVQVTFMFYFFTFRPGWSRIQPPDKVAWLDPISGKLTAFASVSPAYFGQTDPVGEFIDSDVYLSLPGINLDERDNMEKRLYVLYDILYKTWAVNPSVSNDEKLKSEAREFLNIFDQISEQPLRLYYNALGRDWFEWLRKLAE